MRSPARIARGLRHRTARAAARAAGAAGSALFGHARPVLFVIGAQKSGTTALYHYLGSHPALARPDVKELNFFCSEHAWRDGTTTYLRRLPLAWPGRPRLSYDVSPHYMLEAWRVAPRLRAAFPGAAVVALLRDPAQRAWSAWHMYRRYHAADPHWYLSLQTRLDGEHAARALVSRGPGFGRDFLADLEEERQVLDSGGRIDMPIIEFGHYARQLAPFVQALGRERVLVMTSRELRADPGACLSRIETLAGLDAHVWDGASLGLHFQGDYQEPPPEAAARFLATLYAPGIAELERLTGMVPESLA